MAICLMKRIFIDQKRPVQIKQKNELPCGGFSSEDYDDWYKSLIEEI